MSTSAKPANSARSWGSKVMGLRCYMVQSVKQVKCVKSVKWETTPGAPVHHVTLVTVVTLVTLQRIKNRLWIVFLPTKYTKKRETLQTSVAATSIAPSHDGTGWQGSVEQLENVAGILGFRLQLVHQAIAAATFCRLTVSGATCDHAFVDVRRTRF